MFDTSQAQLRAVAFYLPQFHPIAENDVFWGAGFTEWRNVVRTRPRFSGHYQPHLPANLGFYDLRLSEIRAAQADMARAAGVHGFNYYHYWFAGRRVLNRPFDEVLASGAPHFPFMLTWANENWTRAWDGGTQEVLLRQSYSDEDTVAHARHLAPAFDDPRYIRIRGKPVFAVYNTDEIPCPERWSDLFRETCLVMGYDVYLVRVERYLDRDLRPPNELGFDAALEFQPFSRSFRRWLDSRPELKRRPWRQVRHRLQTWRYPDTHYDMAAFVSYDIKQPGPAYTCFPGVCPSWDNSARRPKGQGIIFRNSAPQIFASWVHAKVGRCPSEDENLLFVNAWNEWAEGNHLEPCLRYGSDWLDVLKRTVNVSSLHCSENVSEAQKRFALPLQM